jgi:hypothetical protein
MRTIFYILALIFYGSGFCYSQTAIDSVISKECSCLEEEFKGWITYENISGFPGGEQARMQYLAENLKHPSHTRNIPQFEGTIFVSFCIEKDGSISGIKIERITPEVEDVISEMYAKEVIRVVQAMPNWNPAAQRGEPICMPFLMPIRFTTDENTSRRRNRNRN